MNKRHKTKIKIRAIEYWKRCYKLTLLGRMKNVERVTQMGIDVNIMETIEEKRLNRLGQYNEC